MCVGVARACVCVRPENLERARGRVSAKVRLCACVCALAARMRAHVGALVRIPVFVLA